MKPVGLVFRPKISFDELRSELIPSFDSVLRDWVSDVRRTNFANPSYMFEITYVTPPLKAFIGRIVERLDIPGIIGGPVERGFGFGKTHALIFLWHLFTSSIYEKVGIHIDDKIVRETLVLGMDFSKGKPLARIVEELKAYASMEHSVVRVKDPQLLRAVAEVLKRHGRELYSLSSEELAELIAEILERYSELGGRPRLLVLVDELGWGLAQKLRSYTDKIREGKRADAESIYGEANTVVNFLSYLYAKLHGKPVTGVVLWVLADQDRKEIKTLAIKHQDDEVIYNKIIGLLSDLDIVAERYSRGLGGTSLTELSYSPEHALEIARYRILRTVEGVELANLQEEYMEWLGGVADQLNLAEVFSRFKEDIRRYYPFSPGLINLLKKLVRVQDVPATEFVRTVIMIASEAVRNALEKDPEGAYTIGVKHLSIPGVVQSKLMREFEADWANAVGDIELALSKIDPDRYEAAEIAAKYILAKGVTANVIAVLETQERKEVERYGSTLDEIQLEVLGTFIGNEAFQIIEKLSDALDRLRAESARIDEREINGIRYYLPSLFKTVYNKLASYVVEEKRNIENKALIPVYIKQTGIIPSIFVNVHVVLNGRSRDVATSLIEYKKVQDIDGILSDHVFQRMQSEGKLLLLLVPPWDMELFKETYVSGKNYEDIVNDIARRLQYVVKQGKIRRPLHIVILVPDLAAIKMDRLLNKLVVYEGTRKFLDYLSRKEDVINERLREYEDTLVKRKDLLSILNEEVKKKHLRVLQSVLEREIAEARSFAQKQLVRLSRDIVISVLELYRKAIYYSIDKNAFTVKDIVLGESIKAVRFNGDVLNVSDLSKYASIVNKFLVDIIHGLAYEYDAIKIMKVLLESYRKEFERGIIRESDRVNEVLENLMLGTYGVKPLSSDIASEAIRYLGNQRIELEDKTIIIVVDRSTGIIRFHVEEKKAVEEISPTKPMEVTGMPVIAARHFLSEQAVQHISLVLPPGFDVVDIRSRFTALMNMLNEINGEVAYIEFRIEVDVPSMSLNMKLEKPSVDALSDSSVRTTMNLLSVISRNKSKSVSMDIHLSKPISDESVRKIFNKYLGAKYSNFDRFLPS